MKTTNAAENARCANEGCRRFAETGSALCETCGLERSLLWREVRRARPRPEPPRADSARRAP